MMGHRTSMSSGMLVTAGVGDRVTDGGNLIDAAGSDLEDSRLCAVCQT
jgi:hypothetical protein